MIYQSFSIAYELKVSIRRLFHGVLEFLHWSSSLAKRLRLLLACVIICLRNWIVLLCFFMEFLAFYYLFSSKLFAEFNQSVFRRKYNFSIKTSVTEVYITDKLP